LVKFFDLIMKVWLPSPAPHSTVSGSSCHVLTV